VRRLISSHAAVLHAAAAARLDGATAAGFAAAGRSTARMFGPAGLDAAKDAAALAGRLAARVAAVGFAAAARLGATAGGLGGATARGLSVTAARFAAAGGLAAARVLGGHPGAEPCEQAATALATVTTRIAGHFTTAARLGGTAASRLGATATGLATAAAHAEERLSVRRIGQRDGDDQHRQQVTSHREGS
jgi:hypothetical protein